MSSVVYDAILGGVNLRQVTQSSYNGNTSIIDGTLSGELDPSELYGGDAQPMASLTSGDLAGVLAGISITAGLAVAAGSIVIPFNERVQGGTFQSGSNHATISSANGLIVPTSFSAGQGDAAALAAIDVHFRKGAITEDPRTAPCAINANQALAAQAFVGQYAMGPVTANLGSEGSLSQVSGISRVAVNPGIEVIKEAFDGHIYPTRLHISRRRPTIDLTFVDKAHASRFGSTYQALVALSVFFRKRADGGTFAADGGANHVKFSFGAGITGMQTVSASGANTGEVTVRIHGKALSAATGQAIA